jgi:chemotaxis signal transduction protein
MKLAQGIICGAWALAFPFDWARQIVDDFELSAVPKAPAWLLGAANVDGNIVPVIDLAQFLGTSSLQANTLDQRLLIGGLQGSQSDEAVAIAFTGLPQQLSYEPAKLSYASALPPKLRELCTGIAKDAAGRDFLEIGAEQLMLSLSDELALV